PTSGLAHPCISINLFCQNREKRRPEKPPSEQREAETPFLPIFHSTGLSDLIRWCKICNRPAWHVSLRRW
ncbi:unnamed protein product, partial [Linum tenue]